MASVMSAGMANVFVLTDFVGDNVASASATDVWKIVCPASAQVANNTASLWVEGTDMANVVLPPMISWTIFKNNAGTTTTDPMDQLQLVGGVLQSLPGPRVTLVQGNGTYYVFVTHTALGMEQYSTSGECQNQFGVPLPATSVNLVSDQ
jgi:hypothetical protein